MMPEALIEDPRLAAVRERLKGVRHVVAVLSSKGGVGKTFVATMVAVALARMGKAVGLMDMDVTNPNAHILLGHDVGAGLPEEEKGIVPPVVAGVRFMTIAYYTGENPAPLRGEDVASAIREVLAITRWGELDYLIIDTPPGMGDELMEILTTIRRAESVIVTTPSPLSLVSARRLVKLLREGLSRVVGVVENMSNHPNEQVMDLAKEAGAEYLGNIPYTPAVDELVGRPDDILETPAGEAVREVAKKLSALLP